MLNAFLGRKARGRMLSRVGAALVQFVRPVSTSTTQSSADRDSQRESYQQPPPRQRPDLKVVETPPDSEHPPSTEPQAEAREQPHLEVVSTPLATLPPVGSMTQMLLSLYQSLHQMRSKISTGYGRKAYQLAARVGRKKKIRKGSLLNHEGA